MHSLTQLLVLVSTVSMLQTTCSGEVSAPDALEVPQGANSTSGVTTPQETSNVVKPEDMQRCKVMNWYNWADFKYACSWNHGISGNNMFYLRYDGTAVYECECNEGLGTYGPWGSHWTWSKTDGIACYTRDGKQWSEVVGQFNAFSCKYLQKNCDTQKGTCAMFSADP